MNLVGWSSSSDSNYSSIGRTTSDSGYYVNELPGINVDLLGYVTDEKNVSDYIDHVHDSEIIRLIDRVIAQQKDKLNTKELLQHNTMIQEIDELDATITKGSRFVGYAITPRESNSIKSTIVSAGFMSSAADSFTLYLFDSTHKAAIQSKTIATTAAETIAWTDLGWTVEFDREAGSAGQTYLIGYFEDDVTADLYDIAWNGNHAHFAQRVFKHYMGIAPVRFNSGTLNGTNIPTLEYLEGAVSCRTSGFNLRFNTKCDITRILEDNITMFGEALQYAIAIRVLQDALAYPTLNNITNAQMLRQNWTELIAEYKGVLHGGILESGQRVKGLIDRLTLDLSTLDAVCLKGVQGKAGQVRW